MNLYDRLGIKKGASLEEIRKAFKKTSKKTHPDKGGTDEEFIKTKEAYEVLANPKKRKQYDETGEVGDEDPKQSIYVEIADMFLRIVDKHEVNIEHLDIIKEMLTVYNAIIQAGEESNMKLEDKIKKTKKLLGRVSRKDGGESVFDGMIQSTINNLEDGMAQNKERTEHVNEIITELDIYECSFEKAEEFSWEGPSERDRETRREFFTFETS